VDQFVPIPDAVEVTSVQILYLPTEVKYFQQDVVRDGVDFRCMHVTLAYVRYSSVLGYRRKCDTRTSRHYFRWFLAEPFCGVSGLQLSDIRY
jgi:hypothetical protein